LILNCASCDPKAHDFIILFNIILSPIGSFNELRRLEIYFATLYVSDDNGSIGLITQHRQCEREIIMHACDEVDITPESNI
jgi:hypothetical protein